MYYSMKMLAPAKINLALDVLGKREDGYHEVRMVMQTISLCDEIELSIGDGSFGSGVVIYQETKEPSPFVSLPADDRNLAVRAAKQLMDEFDIRENLIVRLTKRIPVAAGLAGGSADAAAVLRGVNDLFRLGLSTEDLMERGVTLGADVPFCVMEGTALAEGIGERLTRLPDMPDCHFLIAKPGIDVSTKVVYSDYRDEEVGERPDIDGMLAAIQAGELGGVASRLCNVLESVTMPRHPVIWEIREHMRKEGAMAALMSGSGPTVFGVFEDEKTARAACDRLRESRLTALALPAAPRRREEKDWQ